MSWSWSLNWDEITDSLVIGTCPMHGKHLEEIRSREDVTAVLSLQHPDDIDYWNIDIDDIRDTAKQLDVVFRRCPIRDFDIQHMREQLPDAVARLTELQRADHHTYLHCTAGRGRAPLTALAYLILVEGNHPEDAIQCLLDARPEVVPSWEALEGCIRDLTQEHRSDVEERAHELYREGVNERAEEDWYQAQREVIRKHLLERI